jgi:hypothetical protein
VRSLAHSSAVWSSNAAQRTLFAANDPKPANPKASYPCSAYQKSCVLPAVSWPSIAESSLHSEQDTPLAIRAGKGCDITEPHSRKTSLLIGQLSTRIFLFLTKSINNGCLYRLKPWPIRRLPSKTECGDFNVGVLS